MTTERLLESSGEEALTRLRLSRRTVVLLAMVVIPMVGLFLADSYLRYQERRTLDLPPPGVLLAMALVEAVSALPEPTPESELLPQD